MLYFEILKKKILLEIVSVSISSEIVLLEEFQLKWALKIILTKKECTYIA